MKLKNPHASLIAYLGGGSRKIGLWVLLALIGVVPLALGRLTWAEYLGGLTLLTGIVQIAIAMEDSSAKRAPSPSSQAIAVAGDTAEGGPKSAGG